MDTARVNVVDSTYQRADMPNGQFLSVRVRWRTSRSAFYNIRPTPSSFDDELSLAQQRSLNKELSMHGCSDDLQILDRTQLVLQIFSESGANKGGCAHYQHGRVHAASTDNFLDDGRRHGLAVRRQRVEWRRLSEGCGESQLEMDGGSSGNEYLA